MNNVVHIGQKIRCLRLLMGLKQRDFAIKMGIAQQNVSKMENNQKPTAQQLEAAARVLGLSVESIEKFNEKTVFNNNIAFEPGAGQTNNVHPINEVIAYFKEELSKRDKKLEELSKEIEILRNEKKTGSKKNKAADTPNLHSIANLVKEPARKTQ